MNFNPVNLGSSSQTENQAGIMGDIIVPFLARYVAVPTSIDPARLQFASAVIGTMVDLYLVTDDASARQLLFEEMAAHIKLIVERLGV